MKIQVIVEDNALDLSNSVEIDLTFSIDDVSKFAARNTSFSKTIVLPGTAQNNFVFGNIFDVNIYNSYNSGNPNVGYNFNAAKSAQCYIYNDNIQVLKGVIRILEITIINGFVEYECAVFGELGGLTSAIGDKLMEVLDFSSENHTLNATNVQASWAAAGTYSYYYPFIDYSNLTTDGLNFDVANLRPAIYVKSYIDKIFAAAGYTYSSSFFSSAAFTNLIIPNNSDGNYIEVTDLFNVSYSGAPATITTDPWIVTYNTTTGTQYASEASGVVTWGRTTAVTMTLTGSVTLGLTNGTGSPISVTLRIYKNGADTGISNAVTVGAGATFTGSLSVGGSVTLNTGDNIKLVVTSGNWAGFTSKVQIGSSFKGGSMSSIKINVAYGDTTILNGSIPKGVKQIDFITSVLNMFNLYITEDKTVEKKVTITPYKDYYDLDPTHAVDWTNKVDYSKPIKIKPLGELNARAFKFTYKGDLDYYSDKYKRKYGQIYGTQIYDTGLELAQGTTTVEVLFQAAPLVSITGNNIIAPAVYKVDNVGIKTTIGTAPMILYRSPATITTTNNFNLKNGVTTVASALTAYPYAGHLDTPVNPTLDLNFGAPAEVYAAITGTYPSANLFNLYWSGYVAELTNKDSKLIAMSVKLNVFDIENLDFSKLVFVGGQIHRLNKIIDYNTVDDEVTSVELVNVINLL